MTFTHYPKIIKYQELFNLISKNNENKDTDYITKIARKFYEDAKINNPNRNIILLIDDAKLLYAKSIEKENIINIII
jgi:hypothetical protein